MLTRLLLLVAVGGPYVYCKTSLSSDGIFLYFFIFLAHQNRRDVGLALRCLSIGFLSFSDFSLLHCEIGLFLSSVLFISFKNKTITSIYQQSIAAVREEGIELGEAIKATINGLIVFVLKFSR